MERFFYPQSITQMYRSHKGTPASDIFHTKFLNEEIATALANLLKEDKNWKKGVYDRRYATHDIPLDKYYPDMYDLIKEQFDNMVIPAMSSVWSFGHKPEADTIFAVKYSEDTQIGLKEHLSPTRANGLVSMIKQIKLYAIAQQANTSN